MRCPSAHFLFAAILSYILSLHIMKTDFIFQIGKSCHLCLLISENESEVREVFQSEEPEIIAVGRN